MVDPTSLLSADFFETFMITSQHRSNESLTLNDTPYHSINTNDISSGYAEVDVKLDDNGIEFNCMLTAGVVGSIVHDSKDLGWNLHGNRIRDVVSPLASWWMFKKPEGE